MGLYTEAVCYSARQDRTIQYNAIQYNTIQHISQNNTQYYRQLSILKFTTTNNQRHLLYTVKSQKRVEPKVDESLLKATRNNKQSVNHTGLHLISHITPLLFYFAFSTLYFYFALFTLSFLLCLFYFVFLLCLFYFTSFTLLFYFVFLLCLFT